jgi:PKHD-type hydroxylase
MKLVTALSKEKAAEYLKLTEKLDWQDGRASAKGSAKEIKSNFQAYPRDPNFKPLGQMLNAVIMGEGPVRGATFPKAVVGVRANKYVPGDTYGWHVDYSHMNGHRTDLSFTLFLAEPDTYKGGELMTDEGGHVRKFKPAAGQMLLYPTGVLHRVAPVLEGERIGIVGWISSLIPSHESREVLLSLHQALGRLKDAHNIDSDDEHYKRLNYSYFQMMRLLTP